MNPPLPTPAASVTPIETDALVIGAGPAGLFAAFELGLLELGAQLVDVLPEPGGQCTALYPDKPIYDIPGLPVVTGRGLVDNLMAQLAPLRPGLHLGQQVATLAATADGRWAATTTAGTAFIARCVVIAAGAGAFVPRSVRLDGIEAHLGRQVLHSVDDAAALAGRRVVILGDEDIALERAIALASPGPHQAASVTLVHRREQFRAEPATVARFQALRAAGAIQFVAGQPLALVTADGPLVAEGGASAPVIEALDLLCFEGPNQRLSMDTLLVLMGLSPKLGPVADWGLAMERRQLLVDTERFETSVPGIYAVGDINTYPGKRKLLLCGFHEATMAAFAAATRLKPEAPVLLQYTTTSPRLHRLLGVAGG